MTAIENTPAGEQAAARQSPNTTWQTIQHGTTGRYTFMGNLNPFATLQVPAAGC